MVTMNPHKGRSAPRKKKKGARKDRKVPLGSCVVTLPCFAKMVEETGRILEEEVFALESPPAIYTKHLVTARGGAEIASWIDGTIGAQIEMLSDCLIRGYLLGSFEEPFVGVPWSVCVIPAYAGMTDFEGFGLIAVVILDVVIVRPVGKIVPGLKSHLSRRARLEGSLSESMERLPFGGESKGGASEEDCWICLDPFDAKEANMLWNSDYFCCGHLVCPKCTPAAAGLKHCGVCRALEPTVDGLEERIFGRIDSP